MIIIRSDTVGQVDMRLVSRPTNTCVGVNNFHFYANGSHFKHPLIRFFGTDSQCAQKFYDRTLDHAKAIKEELS